MHAVLGYVLVVLLLSYSMESMFSPPSLQISLPVDFACVDCMDLRTGHVLCKTLLDDCCASMHTRVK